MNQPARETPPPPDVSIVVPVYNRGLLIRHTLESIRRASAGLTVETIIVDDGSTTPVADSLAEIGFAPAKLIRQENRGLLFARLAGFAAVTGRTTLFLDSDDLISPEKLRAQVSAMDAARADVSYTDTAHATLVDDYEAIAPVADAPERDAADSAEFFITVQPAPHSPVFRTGFLRTAVAQAFFPPSPLYNAVAEIWFYHVAAIHPARVIRVAGAHTIVGVHSSGRLTNHWERLAVASLGVMEAFARHCPRNPDTQRARQLVGEKAFRSWRQLPRGFSREFEERELAVWRRLASRSDLAPLGGGNFRRLARLLGPELAARAFRRWQNGPYDRCRTLSDADVRALLSRLPPP